MKRTDTRLTQTEIGILEKIMDSAFGFADKDGFGFKCRDFPSMKSEGSDFLDYGNYAKVEASRESDGKYITKVEIDEKHPGYQLFLEGCRRQLRILYEKVIDKKAA